MKTIDIKSSKEINDLRLLQKRVKRQKWYIRGLITLIAIIGYLTAIYVGSLALTPVLLKWFPPITPPVITIKHVEAKEIKAPKAADIKNMTTEEYICWKFGDACKMALAVSQAENGTRQCDRFGVNTNKTIDAGIFQINTVHLKKGWKLADLLDCKKNVDYAYEIYKAQGFQPWVAYTTGAYKRFIN